MSWQAVQESMKARKAFVASALGVLWMLVGAELLRRPGTRWIPALLIGDGALTVGTGKGLINHLVGVVQPNQSSGEKPAEEV